MPATPPANGVDFQNYDDLFRHIMMAIKQRVAAFGGCVDHWPKTALTRYYGKVGTVVDNLDGDWTLTDNTTADLETLEDSSGFPCWAIASGDAGKLWVGFARDPSAHECWKDGDYDVIFSLGGDWPYGGHWDETKQVRCAITDNTDGCTVAPTLTFDATNLINMATAGYWSGDMSDLTDKLYYIIPRGSTLDGSSGTWWADRTDELRSRWIPWPNEREHWHGTVTSWAQADPSDTAHAGTWVLTQTNDVYDPTKLVSWSPDAWAGKEVLVMSGHILKRLTIASNDCDKLYISGVFTTFSIGRNFSIVDAGGKGFPDWNTRKFYPFNWYGGAMKDAQTVSPLDDSLTQVFTPADSVLSSRPQAGTGVCEPQLKFLFDDEAESWTDHHENCGCPDNSGRTYSPHFYKNIHGWQKWIANYCQNFINPHLGSNSSTTAPHPSYNFATLMLYLGINAGSSTVAESGGNFSFIVSSAYAGKPIYYAVVDSGKHVISRGMGGAVAGWTTVGAGGTVGLTSALYDATEVAADPTKELDTGKTVYWTLGFTREFPLSLRYPWAKTTFIPSVSVSEDGDRTPVDAPSTGTDPDDACFGTGSHQRRERSSTYGEYNDHGQMGDAEQAPALGDVVRIVGDNFADPVIKGTTTLGTGYMGEDDGTALYWLRMYEGQHARVAQHNIRVQLSGKVTRTMTSNSMTDDTKAWLDDWYGADVCHTQYLTATGGSTNTLIDPTTDPADVDNENGCWFRAERFPDGEIYKDFVIAFTSGTNLGEKRVITSYSSTTKTVTFAPALAAPVANGDTAVIEEAYGNNRFEGRILRLYDDDGSWTDVQITHSHRDTLFWSSSSGIGAVEGQKYRIIQPEYGGVYQYASAAPAASRGDVDYYQVAGDRFWVPLEKGTSDPRGQPWHESPSENLPHKAPVTQGFFRAGDYVTTTLLKNVWDAIAELKITDVTGEGGWHDESAPNTRTGTSHPSASVAAAWDNAAYGDYQPTRPCCFCGSYFTKCCTTPLDCGSTTSGFPTAVASCTANWLYVRNAQCGNCCDNLYYMCPEGVEPFQENTCPFEWIINSGGVSASLDRHMDTYRVRPPQCLSKSVEFFNYAVKPCAPLVEDATHKGSCTFDANGDEVAENQWRSWYTSPSQMRGYIPSEPLGSMDPPNQPTMPASPSGEPEDFEGIDKCRNQYQREDTGVMGYTVTGVKAYATWTFDYIP